MTKRRLVWIGMMLCMCFLLLPCAVSAISTADAAEPVSLTTDCSLTAVYSYENTAFSGIGVNVYRIADVSADCRFTYTEEFAACALPLNGMQSDSEWDALRSTLEAYIMVYDPQPYAAAVTDAGGKVCFEKLEPGLYFIPAVQYSAAGYRYSFSCSLTALPGLEQKDGTWDYTVQTKPKPSMKPPAVPGIPEEPEEIPFKVIKLWKDAGNEYARPKSVVVDIYQNGKPVNTAILSDATNWSYQWYAEDDGSVWTVMERNVPDGYVMTLENRGAVFVLTNIFTETSEEEEETTETEETHEPETAQETSDETVPPEETEEPTETEEWKKDDREESPQTGDTFRIGPYIAVMCISGCLLILLGITGKRKTE